MFDIEHRPKDFPAYEARIDASIQQGSGMKMGLWKATRKSSGKDSANRPPGSKTPNSY